MLVSSKRSRGYKTHYCYYCELSGFKLARHLENNHGQEVEVDRELSLPKRSKKRQNAWLELAREGDYKVNIKNLRKNSGKISASQRSGKMNSIKDFAPRICCQGFFLRQNPSTSTPKSTFSGEKEMAKSNIRKVLAR